MRGIALVVMFGALAACTTAPPPMARTAEKQQEFEHLLAGKVAGPPLHCLQTFDMTDMVRIDPSTVAYRAGSRVYVNNMQSPCGGLDGTSIMVTRTVGGETCRGDIVQMVDSSSRMMTGSCVFGDFVPYVTPR